jgi:hypothetical protein
VESNVFDRVFLRFLPVGHTHEDIDQVFSRTTIRLRKHHALSRPHLAYQLRHGFTKYGKRPLVFHWDTVANISGWLQSRTSNESGWMSYRHFRFLKSSQLAGASTGCMQVRDNMRDVEGDDWRGLTEFTPYHKNLKVTATEFMKALKDRSIPVAQRTEPNMEWLEKRTKAIKKLAETFPIFTETHQIDCLAMIDMEYCMDDIPFNWTKISIDEMFNGIEKENKDNGEGQEMKIDDGDKSEIEEEDQDKEKGNNSEEERATRDLISKVKVGHHWMFTSDDESPFWVGKIIKITEEGARVQYYVPDEKKDKNNKYSNERGSLDYHLSAQRFTPTNYNARFVDKYDFVNWDEGFVVRVNLTNKNALNQQHRAIYEGWAKRAILSIQQGNPRDDEPDE